MKGKVLSVRISEKDLASCVELCNSVHLKPIGMGGYLTKTLGILLENLRQAHKVMNMSESQAREVLKQTFGDREVGYSCELPDNFADWPNVGSVVPEVPKVPHFDTTNTLPRFNGIEETHKLNYDIRGAETEMCLHEMQDILREGYQEVEDSLKFDQDLEEEIRLSAMLEGENLIDKLLVTEHRQDDKEVKLMNPDLVGPVPTKKGDENGES
jgi:hypothetical protein